MTSTGELSDEQLEVLDAILNLEPVTIAFLAGLRIHQDITLSSDALNETLEMLSKHRLVAIAKEQYQTIVTINADSRNIVREILEGYWKRNNVDELSLRAESEKNVLGTLRLLEFRYDDKPHIGFSDYFTDATSVGICNALARARLVFKQTWSSRKHYYESYYLRKFPFDAGKIVEQLIVEKINLKDLDISQEWPVVIMAVYSDTALRLEDLGTNFPHLTSDEVNELLSKLEQRGILSRLRGEISIQKTTRDLVKNYFLFNQYNQFKSAMLQQLRGRVSERTTNLFILGLARRILASAPLPKTSEPFCSIKRDLLRNINEDDLKQASKLGVLFLTNKEVIVAHDLVAELESVLKSALAIESFMTIPPNDNLGAMRAWVQVFGHCKDYAKIWDEYINEETLDIIDRFCPKAVSITILSAIEKPRQIDVDEMEDRVRAIRNSGRKIRLFFVGDVDQGKAPFHKRYIITRDACYLLTSSIKEVGKSKSVDVVGISEPVKASEVEPAFSYWTDVPVKELLERGHTRIAFEEWITRLRKSESSQSVAQQPLSLSHQ